MGSSANGSSKGRLRRLLASRAFRLLAGGLAAVLAGYMIYFVVLSGELQSLEPHFDGSCAPVIGAVGAEDITIQPGGGMAYVSSADRRAGLAGVFKPGAIMGYHLEGPKAGKLVNLTPRPPQGFHPHGVGLLSRPGKPDRLFVVNHPWATPLTGQEPRGPAHTVEIFELRGQRLEHLRTVAGDALVSPNDVAPAGPKSFYVTNDHGGGARLDHLIEDGLRLARSHLLYHDGETFKVVDDGIRYANGVALSRDLSRVYVAATTDRALRIYSRRPDGDLKRLQVLDLGTGVDNIEVDGQGNLWIGAHPKLLTFVAHAMSASTPAPSQVLQLSPDGAGGFRSREVLLSDGLDMAASSVAARAGDRLLVGGVFDARFLDCRMGRAGATP